MGNWKTSLPPSVVRMLAHLPPYPSQIQWLGYALDDYKQLIADPPAALTTRHPPAASTLPFFPLDFMASEETGEAYYPWLNSVSDRDPSRGRIPPTITNLGAYLYRRRSDLQTFFPDLYGADRVAFSHWFTEISFIGSATLDAFFTVPVYESWLNGPVQTLE